jgi:hypothetical protein
MNFSPFLKGIANIGKSPPQIQKEHEIILPNATLKKL